MLKHYTKIALFLPCSNCYGLSLTEAVESEQNTSWSAAHAWSRSNTVAKSMTNVQGQVALHQSRLVVTHVYAGVASRSVRSLKCTS